MIRQPGESFEDFKARRKQEQADLKKHLLGRYLCKGKGIVLINQDKAREKIAREMDEARKVV
jgi:hypothetical protein